MVQQYCNNNKIMLSKIASNIASNKSKQTVLKQTPSDQCTGNIQVVQMCNVIKQIKLFDKIKNNKKRFDCYLSTLFYQGVKRPTFFLLTST